jgi:hypothetical protein
VRVVHVELRQLFGDALRDYVLQYCSVDGSYIIKINYQLLFDGLNNRMLKQSFADLFFLDLLRISKLVVNSVRE